MPFDTSTLVIVLIIVIYMLSSIKILAEYERGCGACAGVACLGAQESDQDDSVEGVGHADG